MTITTPEEWWQTLDSNWKSLLEPLSRFLPLNENLYIDSDTCEMVGCDKPMIMTVERLKEDRSPTIVHYLCEAWDAAPDSRAIHSIPGWNTLCDLLSEQWALYPEEE